MLSLSGQAYAQASAHPLVKGQSVSLPMTEESDGPALKFVVASAAMPSYGRAYVGETKADRKARGDQVVLETIYGQYLVQFVRFAADDLRTRYAASAKPQPVTVTASFTDAFKIDNGALWGDSLKAGFTFGIAAPSTTPMVWESHIDLTIEDADGTRNTYSCDAKELGRTPVVTAEHMAMQGRKACYAQIVAKLNGGTALAAGATN